MNSSYRFFIGNDENRQHITLSHHTKFIIEEDMVRFDFDRKKRNKSGFLNLIFKHYYESSPVSLRYLTEPINHLLENVLNHPELQSTDPKQKDFIFNQTIHQVKLDFVQNMEGLHKDHPFKLKLNKENVEIIESLEEAPYFEQKGLSFYLSSLFDAYARLPLSEREKIVFKDRVDTIQLGLEQQRWLKITTKDNRTSYFNPYKIHLPYGMTHHSLLGYKEGIDSKFKIPFPDSLLIKDIRKVQIIKARRSTIQKYRDHIETMLKQRYKMQKPSPIHMFQIQFSKDMVELFQLDEFMRPIANHISKVDEAQQIYTFECIEEDIIHYFFKYGPLIKILEPQETVEKFALLYKKSYEKYLH